MTKENYHIPVLLHESVDGLAVKPDGVYVDVTFGGGGHSREILSRLGEGGRLISFDQDADAAKNRLNDSRFTFVASNFAFIENHLRFLGIDKVDGILADLGVSSHQFDEADRGFSIRMEGPLDMRMNKSGGKTALQFILDSEEVDLATVFAKYGELKRVRAIAATVKAAAQAGELKTTQDLITSLKRFEPPRKEAQFQAKVFQALRLAVNDEMQVLEDFLNASAKLLKTEGRLSVISYHSLEDRPVKNIIKRGNIEGVVEKDFYGNPSLLFKDLTRKPIVPSEEEIERNPRARSAKLRIGEKL